MLNLIFEAFLRPFLLLFSGTLFLVGYDLSWAAINVPEFIFLVSQQCGIPESHDGFNARGRGIG